MLEPWMTWTIFGCVAVGLGLYLRTRGRAPINFADPREERLTRQLAELVGCDLHQALPAVQREIGIAPAQADETILKRAAYHYRMEQPERVCTVYRDRAPT